jgi:hypothetical protein
MLITVPTRTQRWWFRIPDMAVLVYGSHVWASSRTLQLEQRNMDLLWLLDGMSPSLLLG